MSPAIIVALVIGGIVALLLVGYINNQYETKKLERARRRSELSDRQARLGSLSEGIPGQYLTVPFKQALHQLELVFVEKLLKEEPGNLKLKARDELLRERIGLGASYELTNSTVALHSEEQVKEIRFQLESLHAQVRRGLQEGLVAADTGRQWLYFLQEQLINLYLDFFHTTGQSHLQRGVPRQARLVFERAVGLIKRQKNLQPYKQRLDVFQELLEKANDIVMEHDQKAVSQANELSESMGDMEEDVWKKKQMYD